LNFLFDFEKLLKVFFHFFHFPTKKIFEKIHRENLEKKTNQFFFNSKIKKTKVKSSMAFYFEGSPYQLSILQKNKGQTKDRIE